MRDALEWAMFPAYWAAVGVNVVSAVALWLPERFRRIALASAWVSAAATAVMVALRWITVARAPVRGGFENALVAAAMLAAVAAALTALGPFRRRTAQARLMMPFVPALLAAGLLFDRRPFPIEAAGRTWLGYLHAFVGWLDFAVLFAAACAAAGLLLNRDEDDAGLWDEMLARLLGNGFALLTATMVSGSIYSFILFSEWYRWQVVETATAAAWLGFASVLHLRTLFNWRGRRAALATLAALPLALVAFWIWSFYPDTYHYFGQVLKTR